MEIAVVSISENQAIVTEKKPITSGTVGAFATFNFDHTWDGMDRTIVWRGSGRTIDDTTASGVIPPEVVSKAGTRLVVGVYGTIGDKATPTVWVDLGVILTGADPSGDESTNPSLPVWAQIMANAEKAQENSDQAMESAGRAEASAERANVTAEQAEALAGQADASAKGAVVIAERAESVAKGRATGYVFDTVGDLDLWLSNKANTANLVLGDNFYVRAVNVPDYWWDGTQKQPLETQKVDLTEYVRKDQYQTQGKPGLCQIPMWATGNYGLIQTNQNTVPGGFTVCCATQADIDSRENKHKPIVPSTLDYAVKSALTKNSLPLTDAEKAAVRAWLGLK